MDRSAVLVVAVVLAAGCAGAEDPGQATPTASAVAVPSPSTVPSPDRSATDVATPSPTETAADPTATPAPSSTDAGPDEELVPPVLEAFAGVTVPRIVVEQGDWYWVRVDGGTWRTVALVEETFVVGDGRWVVEWDAPEPTLRAVDDQTVTCAPPDGFLDVALDWAVIHEAGVTSVFVEQEDGTVASVVCEDPGRDPPVDWAPPEDLGDGELGAITLVDDGVTLLLRGDAEGNVTVYDETGDVELVPYAISGPYVDADRGILVWVAQDGGMHFAGGTLVVTGLDGDERRRVDLGGTSTLVGLLDGLAVLERVDVIADFRTTAHVLVDVDDGSIVADVPTDVRIAYAGD